MDPGGAIITINALTGGHPPRPYNAVVQVNLFQKLITSGEHVVYQNCSECQNKTKICVHNMFCRYSELTILMNNEQSVIITIVG